MAYADALRASSEARKLKNLMGYVATESTELLTLALTTNATAEACLQMPSAIGNKQYWLRLRNDSRKAWLEGGLGNTLVEETELSIYLPKEAEAKGYFVSGYGAAYLKCYVNAGVLQVQLASSRESD